MNKDIDYVLIGESELDGIVRTLAKKIENDYINRQNKLLLLGILKGSVIFFGDLMKHLDLPMEIDFMKVSSYGNVSDSSGRIKINIDLNREDLPDTDILIIEDIVDSGRTLSFLTEYLKEKGAKSVKCCALLDKPSRRAVEFNADYVGKIIPDRFVVGYGLDYAERYRALPYIGVLKEEVYL